jgi:hypothetical protein
LIAQCAFPISQDHHPDEQVGRKKIGFIADAASGGAAPALIARAKILTGTIHDFFEKGLVLIGIDVDSGCGHE